TVLKNDKLAGKTSTREPLTTPLTADETQGTLPPSAGQILEEGLDHLQEQTVQQSIEKQSARVYKHPESFSTFVAPFRLPVQRADQRTRWERFVDKWFGPAPLGKEQRERFEIRLDDPIVARALAGKLSKLDTQHVLDRVRYMTIYGNRTERLNALQIVNQAAASFME